jgi:phytoene desaturase
LAESGQASFGEAYDLVVIGSGLAGLMAAAMCAKAGRSVLVVEQSSSLGGYAHSFSRGSYLFDAGIHGTSFGMIEPTLPTLLGELGVGDQVEFARCEGPLFAAFLPGVRFDAPGGADNFLEAHAEVAPGSGPALRRLYSIMQGVTEELTRPRPAGSLASFEQAEGSFETLLRYRTATLDEVFDEVAIPERLRAVLGAPWVNLGLPPSRLAFVAWAPMTVVRVETGEHYCRGSFQRLADALASAVRASGGEIAVETAARRIVVENGRAVAVELEGGARVRASAVVSNADARGTFERLVGHDQVPARFARRLSRMRESLSACVLYAAAAFPREAIDLPHVSHVHDSWDHADSYLRMERGELASIMITVPTLTDPSLAPAGEQLVNCVALVGRGDDDTWARSKEQTQETLLDRVDAVLPGFRDRLTFAEVATPVALEGHAWNYRGAAYGWDNSPAHVGSRRLSSETPIAGLFLAGHWAQPGTGSLAVIYSGVRAANSVLGRPAEHLSAAS